VATWRQNHRWRLRVRVRQTVPWLGAAALRASESVRACGAAAAAAAAAVAEWRQECEKWRVAGRWRRVPGGQPHYPACRGSVCAEQARSLPGGGGWRLWLHREGWAVAGRTTRPHSVRRGSSCVVAGGCSGRRSPSQLLPPRCSYPARKPRRKSEGRSLLVASRTSQPGAGWASPPAAAGSSRGRVSLSVGGMHAPLSQPLQQQQATALGLGKSPT
jgi:hypothetical protein